jgi:hypothetical protein
MNWRIMTRKTNTPITRKPMGHASYAMEPRKPMRETDDTSMQRVGIREDKEKKTYERYMSRERCYEK